MAITRFRPIHQPVTLSGIRPTPWFELFDDWFSAAPTRPQEPAVHVERSEGGVSVRADLPGVRREDLEVTTTPDGDGALVTIGAVRHLGNGEQRFRWSARVADVDPDTVAASLADGVLTLRATVRPGPVARTVEVSVEEQPVLDTSTAEPVSTEDAVPTEDTVPTETAVSTEDAQSA